MSATQDNVAQPSSSAPTAETAAPSLSDLLHEAKGFRARNAWAPIAALAVHLPSQLDAPWAELASEVAFALGQLDRHDEAIAVLERAWQAEPTPRRASALAYQHYDAAMQHRGGGPRKELLREGFDRWIGEALRLQPSPIKDLYRLGVFEAQVESRRDKPALRAFLAAIQAYDELDDATRARRHDYKPYYARALYAAARSALRLGQHALARRLVFACIRFDQDSDHVEPAHKLGLAGRACLAVGELEPAERAFRKALDAAAPRRPGYLYGYLARVAAARGDHAGACAHIERNIRPERRSSALWRQLGEHRRDAGRVSEALDALRSALSRDRGGRHLTLTLMGDLHAARNERKQAIEAYRKALAFRRRRYQSEHEPAARALQTLGVAPQAEATVHRASESTEPRKGPRRGRPRQRRREGRPHGEAKGAS